MFKLWLKDLFDRYTGRAKRLSLNLGALDLPKEKLDTDFAVLDRYQAFSAELLRIALIGVGVFAFLFKESLTGSNNTSVINFIMALPYVKAAIYTSVSLFAVSAFFALVYRYFSADSLAYHLRYLRLEMLSDSKTEKEKRLESINKKAEKAINMKHLEEYLESQIRLEKWNRNINFKICSWSIPLSTFTLAVGAISLAVVLLQILNHYHELVKN